VPAQVVVLLALSAKLFDPVPLEQMMEAEGAVQKAAADMPADVRAHFEAAADLNDQDRTTILAIARQALARFQPKPESKPEANPEPAPKPEAQAAGKPEPKPGLDSPSGAKPPRAYGERSTPLEISSPSSAR
jgi:F-type H+/Na+-transporting ATPase subunit alpha